MFDTLITEAERAQGSVPVATLLQRCLVQWPEDLRKGGGYEEVCWAVGPRYFSLNVDYDPDDPECTGFYLSHGLIEPTALAFEGQLLEDAVPVTAQAMALLVSSIYDVSPQQLVEEAIDLNAFWDANGFVEPAEVPKAILMQYRVPLVEFQLPQEV